MTSAERNETDATQSAPGSTAGSAAGPTEGPTEGSAAVLPGSGRAEIRPPSPSPRLLEWLWRGRALAEARAAAQTADFRVQELQRRARLAAELGTRALEPAGPLVNGTADAVACELYRQSIYWSVRALCPESSRSNATRPDALALWAAADRAALAAALGDGEDLALAKRAVVEQSFADFAELPAAEQGKLARRLRQLAAELIDHGETAQRAIDRALWQRATRIGFILVLTVTSLWAQSTISERLEAARDLARGKPWKASSVFQPACTSPAQDCPESPHFFFITQQDDSPTIEFDLLAPQRVSAVKVTNRTDSDQERAVPLAVEVSQDGKSWKEVARRTEIFSEWKAEFPTVSARYVRLRGLRKTWLHFKQVRILP